MAELNFATRMLLPAAVLILLSVAAMAEDGRRCYWCGPLAEQVHRSQRAPPCGPDLQETMCDPGYTHCAIVATSPPYAESRLCVKFYQDECYSLYCNTSKTWRMICPCQGSLCNEQNTDRETRAFATLAKNAVKNKRSKRSLSAIKGFLPISPRRKVLNENDTIKTPNEITHGATQFDEHVDDHMYMIPTTPVIINDILEQHDIENVQNNNIEESTEIGHERESEMQRDQPIESDQATTEDDNKSVRETLNVIQTETTKTMDDINMNSVAPIGMLKNEDDDTVSVQKDLVKETQETTDIPTTIYTIPIPTSIEIEVSVIQIQNPDDNLPPPEALQQNVSPGKETTPTTIGAIEMVTNTIPIKTTTHSIEEITKTIDKTDKAKDTKNNNGDPAKMDEKNGEEPAQSLCLFFYIINLMIAIALL